MNYTINVRLIGASKKQPAGSQHEKITFTAETLEKYPQKLQFELWDDKCDILKSYHTGDEVKVSFEIRGREWEGKNGKRIIMNLRAWKLERLATGDEGPQATTPSAPPAPPEEEDLPF